jgi:histidine ammonia-lyase
VRDAVAQAARVLEIELNAVTDNPLVFPDAEVAGEAVISAGHFHGMPLALAMSYVKAAIPVLASISERRLNKLLDPATNDGLPAFLVGNEDGTESGHMIVQYTAAAIVNDLASRAMPASVYSIPTSANAEDHVSMGANEARHVLAMADDLGKVLGLELFTAAQALDVRLRMLESGQALAADAGAFAAKVQGGPAGDGEARVAFLADVDGLRTDLREAGTFRPGHAVAAAHVAIRERIAFLAHDRALDGDVGAAIRMVEDGSVLAAVRAAG